MDAIVEFANPVLRRYALRCRGRYVIFRLHAGRLEAGEQVSGLLETLGRETWHHAQHGKMRVFVEDFQRTRASATRWVGVQAPRSTPVEHGSSPNIANMPVGLSRAFSS